MKKSFIFSLKILLFGIILPFRIWQFSKNKLMSKADTKSITKLLDDDYIATSWFDLMIDAIIFIMYPIGLLIVIMIAIFGFDILYKKFIFLLLASIVIKKKDDEKKNPFFSTTNQAFVIYIFFKCFRNVSLKTLTRPYTAVSTLTSLPQLYMQHTLKSLR